VVSERAVLSLERLHVGGWSSVQCNGTAIVDQVSFAGGISVTQVEQ
jgi:hypothetical protein